MFDSQWIPNQLVSAIPTFLFAMLIGLGCGWPAPMFYKLTNSTFTPHFSDEECSWIASCQYIGRSIGPIYCFLMMDRVGRRPVIISSGVMFLISWLFLILNESFWAHICSRLSLGLGIGIFDTVTSLYLGEICLSPKLRGMVVATTSSSFFTGELLMFMLASFLPYKIVHIVSAIISVIALITTVMMKESPQYLITKMKLVQAKDNYEWLSIGAGDRFKSTEDVEKNFILVRDHILNSKCSLSADPIIVIKKIINDKFVMRGLRVLLIISAMSISCGYCSLNLFIGVIVKESRHFTPTTLIMIFGISQSFFSIMAPFIIERMGRRTLIFVSSVLMMPILLSIAALYSIFPGFMQNTYSTEVIFFLITLFLSIYCITLFPVMVVIRGELLPQYAKALGNTVNTFLSSSVAVITVKIFLSIMHYGQQYNFLLYAVILVGIVVYTYYDIPETKGKTLIEIQNEMMQKAKE